MEAIKTTRRKVIPDSMITEDVYDELLSYTCFKLSKQDKETPVQMDIINILKPLNVCNATMAKVINDIIPTARATQGSVASLLQSSKRNNALVDSLLAKIEEDMAND